MNHTAEDLKMMQSLPLSIKVRMTEERIRQWYQYWGGKVCVSFSGGKDSTVLMHIARGLYPDIPAVFSNTGLEYPEIQRFVREYGDVDIVTPKMNFKEVVTTYGYPLISKEVSEAIYYARRIRSQNSHVERETTATQADGTARETDRRRVDFGGTRTEQRRINLKGERYKWHDYHRRCLNIGDSEEDKDAFFNKPKETSWADWRRGCL